MPDMLFMPNDPDHYWMSAAEIAAAKLPGMPHTARSVQRIALTDGWNAPEREGRIWRMRQGRGGGVEYHRIVLPPEAQARLALADAAPAPEAAPPQPTDAHAERWHWFERQTDRTKQRARDRLRIVAAIYALTDACIGKTQALNTVARAEGVGISTLQQWDALVRDVPREHWLVYLAPGHGGGRPQAACDEAAWQYVASLYFGPSRLPFLECWRQLGLKALETGWKLPSQRTLYARLQAVPEPARVLLREGVDALKRRLPAQRRDRSVFHAMEALNGDFHTFDVFVKWDDGSVSRPFVGAFQDIYSGKFLAWRVDQAPSWHPVRLAFGDVVERYGIPRLCYLDNGREFASKRITGGQKTRYRFTIRNDEPNGLMTDLGVEVHWTQPYHGQSKPIERGFRDFAQNIARRPEFAGAYAGNSPVNKPADYGQRAVPIAEFIAVLRQGIAQHNARPDRQSAVCNGRSFNETFEESYARASITRATAEQRRLWLLAAEGVRVGKQDGKLRLYGNEYWGEFLLRHMGQQVTVRFDPAALHQPLHVYTLDGRYLGAAECWAAVGFNDAEAAQKTARMRKRVLRAIREQADAMALMPARELAKVMPKIPEEDAPPAPAAVRLFTAGAAALRPAPQAEADWEEPDELTRRMGLGFRPRVIDGGAE
jgi:putative transposase